MTESKLIVAAVGRLGLGVVRGGRLAIGRARDSRVGSDAVRRGRGRLGGVQDALVFRSKFRAVAVVAVQILLGDALLLAQRTVGDEMVDSFAVVTLLGLRALIAFGGNVIRKVTAVVASEWEECRKRQSR